MTLDDAIRTEVDRYTSAIMSMQELRRIAASDLALGFRAAAEVEFRLAEKLRHKAHIHYMALQRLRGGIVRRWMPTKR